MRFAFEKSSTISDQHCISFEANHQHSRLSLVRMRSHHSRITLVQRHGQVAVVGGWGAKQQPTRCMQCCMHI